MLLLSFALMSIMIAGRDAQISCLTSVGFGPMLWTPMLVHGDFNNVTLVIVRTALVAASGDSMHQGEERAAQYKPWISKSLVPRCRGELDASTRCGSVANED